jgi:hypothetical protein
MARLASHLLVSALLRATSAAGGFGVVIRKGDRDAGAILIQCVEKGENPVLLEPHSNMNIEDSGGRTWSISGPPENADPDEHAQYLERRTRIDPDIWIIELDIAGAAQFAVECLRDA